MAYAIPKEFIWRRLHSLMGLWLVLFLIEHLLANSQAALWLGDHGRGFVEMVNGIHNLPYLQVIECTLLGIPFLIHAVWGVKYLFTAKSNSSSSDGTRPQIKSGRNRAYTWQRITSWIILVILIFHVVKFRFLEYPTAVQRGSGTTYLIPVDLDEKLYALAERLDVTLYDAKAIEHEKAVLDARASEQSLVEVAKGIQQQGYDPLTGPIPQAYDPQKAVIFTSVQNYEDQVRWVEALEKEKISQTQVVAAANDFGTASLLAVRNVFKSPFYMALYTVFVIATCFHACNGFWTFLITWGLVLKMAAQRAWVTVSVVMMAVLIFLGLAAVWGS